MEADLEHIYSREFRKEGLEKQLDKVKTIIDDAQAIQDYKTAHNPEILLALSILEDFLRKRRRICYGGQAINAYLPKKYKFYTENDLPDYDFFSPTQDADIDDLIAMFYQKGFKEIAVRLSVHGGTKKVYVNYTAIADVTQIDPYVFKKLSEKAQPFDGVYYADPDFLRMMMYLEISRPAGEVGRWEKVYERLLLLNTFNPPKKCRWNSNKKTVLLPSERMNLLQTLAAKHQVICGLDVYSALKTIKKVKTLKWFMKREPMMAYTASLIDDANFYRDYFQKIKPKAVVKVEVGEEVGEIVPPIGIVRVDGEAVLVLIQETACHSYLTLRVKEGFELRLASVDTLITLYFSMAYHPDLEKLIAQPLNCLVYEMVLFSINQRSRFTGKEGVPFLSITCSGHQKSLATLFKERDVLKKKLKAMAKAKLNTGSGSGKTMSLRKPPTVRNTTLKKRTNQ
jgi:hypothetical protein